MASKRPVAIDLFSGGGGLCEGLFGAGFRVAVALEKHPHPALTCAFNHPDTKVICDDILKATGKSQLARMAKLVEQQVGTVEIDLLAAAPPCQGFSPAGLQKRNDPRNSLFREYIKVVRYFKPRLILFENVPGFIRQYDGFAAKQLVKSLHLLGYDVHGISDRSKIDVSAMQLFDAAEFGVPQSRRRFMLIGWRRDLQLGDFKWPKATHGLNEPLKPFVTIKEALDDLAFLQQGRERLQYPRQSISEYQKERRNNTDILFNHLATQHRDSTTRMFSRLEPGNSIRSIPRHLRSGKQTMSRMHPNRLSKVVLALPDDFVHYSLDRIPTVREMARLQSFDDDFVFLGRRTTCDKYRQIDVPQYTQVGNAIPPLLAKAVGIQLLKMLGFRKKEMRSLNVRRDQQQWLRGSSCYAGYALSPEATEELNLATFDGKRWSLPISENEKPVASVRITRKWTGRGLRKPNRMTVIA